MPHILQLAAHDILHQLIGVLQQFDAKDYSKSSEVLLGNTIGKHTRHTIEAFNSMIQAFDTHHVDYDKRKRNIVLELDPQAAISELENIITRIHVMPEDTEIQFSFTLQEGMTTVSSSSLHRELAFAIDHAIHHMAIIRIGITQTLPHIQIPAQFGFAYSTIQHQQIACAQ